MVVAIGRPLGITVISVLLTIVGGAMTMVTIFEVFDALRSMGFEGVSIISPLSLIGFVTYGMIPIVFYMIGMGLFLSRYWAYEMMIKIFPIACFILFFVITVSIIQYRFYYYYHFNLFRAMILHPRFFVWMIFWYVLLIWPLFLYLKSPYIESYFNSIKKEL